jgi:L-arabinose isomerase
MNSPSHTRLGLFGIGLDTYWPQFKGLKNRLVGYQRLIASQQHHRTTNET